MGAAQVVRARFSAPRSRSARQNAGDFIVVGIEGVGVDLDDVPVGVHQVDLGEACGRLGNDPHALELADAGRPCLPVPSAGQMGQGVPIAADPDREMDVAAVESLAVAEGRAFVLDQVKLLVRTQREPSALEVEIRAGDLGQAKNIAVEPDRSGNVPNRKADVVKHGFVGADRWRLLVHCHSRFPSRCRAGSREPLQPAVDAAAGIGSPSAHIAAADYAGSRGVAGAATGNAAIDPGAADAAASRHSAGGRSGAFGAGLSVVRHAARAEAEGQSQSAGGDGSNG